MMAHAQPPDKSQAPPSDEYRTVASLAAGKCLPVEFLRHLGVHDLDGGGVGIPYFDTDGAELFVRERGSQHCHGKKRFHQPAGVALVPYGLWRLNEARRAGMLVLVEGESDTWTLWHHSVPALGMPGNTIWSKLEAEHLAGLQDVYLSQENDKGGKTFVEGMTKRLAKLGFDGRVWGIEWPQGCKDPSDLHRRAPERFLDEFQERVKLARELTPKRQQEPAHARRARGGDGANEGDHQPTRVLEVVNAASLMMRPIHWLVPGFIPRGGLTVIAGDGGYGKSSLTIHLAARLSLGEPCFGLPYPPTRQGRTLLVGCEDSRTATVLPRLAAADAALSLVDFVGDVKVGESDTAPFVLSSSGIEALENLIRQAGDVVCVVIDPVSAFVPEMLDDHKDAHVRRMLRPLAEMAERVDIAIVLVRHLNKSDSSNGGNLISGSRAYVNAARAAFLVGPDPDNTDEDRRVLVFAKRNLGPRRNGVAFEAVPLTPDEQEAVLAMPQAANLSVEEREELRNQLFRMEWLGETDATDADLARARRGTAPATRDRDARVAACGEWLRRYLAAGPRESSLVLAEAKKAGFSRNITYEAKKAANPSILASNSGSFRGKWHWHLADGVGNAPLPE